MKTIFILGVSFIVGWNLFLIQRDQKLYDAYYSETMEVRK